MFVWWLVTLVGAAPELVVDDELGCVDQAALEAAMPDVPPGTAVWVALGEDGSLTVRVELADKELPTLLRQLPVAAEDCPELPGLVGVLVDRFIADVPATAWERSVPEAHEKVDSASVPLEGQTPAKPGPVRRPLRLLEPEPGPKKAWAYLGGGLQVGLDGAMADGFATQRGRVRLAGRGGGRWRGLRGGLVSSVAAELWRPVSLGSGQVVAGGGTVGAGLSAGFGLLDVTAGLRAGGLVASSLGFDAPRASVIPITEVVLALELALAPGRFRVELGVPLFRPRFRVQNLAEVRETPVFWVGVAAGVDLGLDLLW